jgi:para-nitrobenzyl esterase
VRGAPVTARVLPGTTVVHTTVGAVLGRRVDDVRRFLGIPYAHSDRFGPPTPPPPWPGLRPAFGHGPACPQAPATGRGADAARAARVERLFGIRSHEPVQDEGCQVLNVWAPADAARPAPVLVWLHGHIATGSAADPWADGAALARDTVVVSVNHRLSVFGHAHDGQAATRGAANAGLLDIVEALRWVRANIGAFGGDPGNVTLGGSSAGALRAACVAGSPRAAGLVHRLALHSLLATRALAPEEAARRTARLAGVLGVRRGLDGLRTVGAAALVRAVHGAGLRFLPVVDGDVLPADPLDLLDRWRHLPLVVGTTRDEGFTFVPGEADATAPARLGPLGDVLLARYRALHPHLPAREVEMEMVAGAYFRRAAFAVAAGRMGPGPAAPTFAYEFAGEMPLVDRQPRSPHGFDIPFAFGNLRAVAAARSAADNRALEAAMTTLWRAFVAGRPLVTGDGTVWSPQTAAHLDTLLIGPRRATMVRGHRRAERRILAAADRGGRGT